MIDAAVFIGEPIDFKGICKIYPPKVKDVVANSKFALYLNILTLTEEDIQANDDKQLSPLEFLLSCCYHDKDFYNATCEAMKFFTHETVTFFFEERGIVIGDINTSLEKADYRQFVKIIEEKNFFDFQNEIRSVVGLEKIKAAPPPDPNEDPRIRKMKEKIRERDKAKAKKASQGKVGNGITLSTSLTAICCMGIGLTPLNIGELSYAAVGPIMKMMQDKEKYDIDIRSLLAGASSKKIKPIYWIREQD